MCLKVYINSVLWASLLALSTTACKAPSDEDGALVRVYDAYLYEKNLAEVIPKGISSADSTLIAQNYIRSWINEQLMIIKAKRNLNEKEVDFAREIEAYKNSLYVFYYQNKLTEQKLDTVVTQEEIRSYYEAHSELFNLKSNIVKVRFVKIKKDHKNANRIKKELFSDDLDNASLVRLSRWCESDAENYFLDNEKWLYFNEFLKEVPIQTYNQEAFLTDNKKIEMTSDEDVYYVVIYDFKTRESISPLSFEEEKIRHIILNQRKQKLLNEFKADIKNEAEQGKHIQFYE